MFRKRLTDKIKAGFSWSVISEEGERIPANDQVQDCERTRETMSHEVDSPWNMEKMFGNSERKFRPEFLLKKSEKEETPIKEPAVKRPTAAFHAAADHKGELPNELVQSSELLAESVISMSVSVLGTEKNSVTPSKKESPVPDRERSIEFKSLNRAG
ncbi:MAG: hypothetical protein FWC43_10780 [Planctomycetaceae bacterium]|nr:hypothetical protein [Planctomycetaceae bacterium]